ncbi:DUF2267 domain-containing protein [Micromonospora sp. NPDC048839]|uniref:DUF2267 domain-containing protein n=1 Tax=Micromonospora sp. NPDC048839 TaxID=3155641 RepID=UPI003405659E
MTDPDGFPYFIDAVSRRSGLPPEQAAALARAVLQTLAERVTGGATDDLVGHLPNEVDGYLTGPAPDRAGTVGPVLDPAGGVGADGGVDGLDTGVDLDVGGAAAVAPPVDAGPVAPPVDAGPVAPPVDAGPVAPPADAGPVAPPVDAGPVAPPVDAGPAEFLRRVGERAGVDPATARAGTGAVFGTLRSAMTVREFRQLVARLPRGGEGGFPSDPYRP